jgi:hypothetical protein
MISLVSKSSRIIKTPPSTALLKIIFSLVSLLHNIMGKKESLVKRIPTKKASEVFPPTQEEFIQQKAGGLFEQAKRREAELKRQQTIVPISTAQYIWQAIFLSIPFGLLLSAFDVTVKVQFDEPWDYQSLFLKTVKAAPGKEQSPPPS